VLGGVKKTISVVVAHNHEMIVAEKRHKITFEDFQNEYFGLFLGFFGYWALT